MQPRHNQRDGDLKQSWHREKLITGWVQCFFGEPKTPKLPPMEGTMYISRLIGNHYRLWAKGE